MNLRRFPLVFFLLFFWVQFNCSNDPDPANDTLIVDDSGSDASEGVDLEEIKPDEVSDSEEEPDLPEDTELDTADDEPTETDLIDIEDTEGDESDSQDFEDEEIPEHSCASTCVYPLFSCWDVDVEARDCALDWIRGLSVVELTDGEQVITHYGDRNELGVRVVSHTFLNGSDSCFKVVNLRSSDFENEWELIHNDDRYNLLEREGFITITCPDNSEETCEGELDEFFGIPERDTCEIWGLPCDDGCGELSCCELQGDSFCYPDDVCSELQEQLCEVDNDDCSEGSCCVNQSTGTELCSQACLTLCEVDDDCSESEVCCDKEEVSICTPLADCPPCYTDNDCEFGQKCCGELPFTECLEQEVCPQCRQDEECVEMFQEGSVCCGEWPNSRCADESYCSVFDHCVFECEEGTTCVGCEEGETCVGDYPFSYCQSDSGNCTLNDDCLPHEICCGIDPTAECKQPDECNECETAQDCGDDSLCCAQGEGRFCNIGQTCSENLVCNSDEDCTSETGQYCCGYGENNWCGDDPECLTPTCFTDEDCPNNAECCGVLPDMTCVEDCPNECTRDSECSRGMRCCGESFDMRCYFWLSCDQQEECATDEHCPSGYLCCGNEPNRVCQGGVNCGSPLSVSCSADEDCVPGTNCCLTNPGGPVCLEDEYCEVGCDDDGDCSEGETCCVNFFPKICVTEEECALVCTVEEGCEFEGFSCCLIDEIWDCRPNAVCGEDKVICNNDNGCEEGERCCYDRWGSGG